MTNRKEMSTHLTRLLFYLLLSTPRAAVRKSVAFDVQYAVLLDRSACWVDRNATCTPLSCAIYCLHESEWCTSFAFEDDGNYSCLCGLCDYIDPNLLQPGDGVIGFMEDHEVDCGIPTEVPGTEVTYESTSQGAVATYSCDADHTHVSGDRSSTCGADARWTSVTIGCVPTGCYFWDTSLGKFVYHGHVNVTFDGIPCQYWGDNSPHVTDSYIIDELTAINSADLDTNYCRSLDGDQVPWCYSTSAKLSEYCDVPSCPSSGP